MRKFILGLSLIFIVCNMFCTAAFAEAAGIAYISSSQAKPREEVELIVSLSEKINFTSLQLEIGYDQTVMTISGEPSNISGVSTNYVAAQTTEKNPYNFGWTIYNGKNFEGDLISIKFLISEDTPAGKYPVSISFYKGRDGNYTSSNAIRPEYLHYLSGYITVTEDEVQTEGAEFSLCLDEREASLGGKLLASMYDENDILLESKEYEIKENIDISFSKKGCYLKLMQWNSESLLPLTKSHRIELK